MKLKNPFKTKKRKAREEFDKYIAIRDKARKHVRWAEEKALEQWEIAYPEKYSKPRKWQYSETKEQ